MIRGDSRNFQLASWELQIYPNFTKCHAGIFIFLFRSSEATVTTIWKMTICKWGVCKWGILKCPIYYVLNFRGWIKLIYDKITLIFCVKMSLIHPLKFRTWETGHFKTPCLQTSRLQTGYLQTVITVAYGQFLGGNITRVSTLVASSIMW